MKIKPIYNKKDMDKNLNPKEIRKLIREMMTRKLSTVKEDDNLGIFGGDFDPYEFDAAAMQAAKADIEASGEKFEPLGTSKFEKGMDPEEFKASLKRANLDLPKEKEELKKLQQTLDKRYKHEKQFGKGSLNETGEWSDDEEGTAWKESLRDGLELIHNMLSPGLPFVIKSIEGFDKYQGPYAIIEIMGDSYKVWTLEDHQFWIENFPIDNTSGEGQRAGFAGNPEEIADAINQQYSIMTHMNEGGPLRNTFDTKSLYSFLKDAMFTFMEADGSTLNYAEAAKFLEEELLKNFNVTKKGHAQFSLNENNGVSKIDRPKDAEGNDITIRARVEDVNTGTVGHVIRFGIDDNNNQTVHVDWMYSFGDAIVKPITYPNKIVVRDDTRIVREEEGKEAYSENRYMFFSNLEQIEKQANILLKADADKINNILENGHDWAQDHIATAKESIDQVFDFLVNEINKEKTEVEEGMGHSFTVGRGQNIKPGNYPQTLKRKGLKEDYDYAAEERAFHNQQNFEEEDEVYIVIDDDFNRTHYKDLIGQTFEDVPPGYAHVKVIKKSEISEEYDFAGEEVSFNDTEKREALKAEMENVVPEELKKFIEPDSFSKDEFSSSFELVIPKQSDETLQDVEKYVREEMNAYPNIELYTELEKMSNKWIIKVKILK